MNLMIEIDFMMIININIYVTLSKVYIFLKLGLKIIDKNCHGFPCKTPMF